MTVAEGEKHDAKKLAHSKSGVQILAPRYVGVHSEESGSLQAVTELLMRDGMIDALDELGNLCRKHEAGQHLIRRRLIASAIGIARRIEETDDGWEVFSRDPFWLSVTRKPKAAGSGDDLLRYVMIRLHGWTDAQRSVASAWAKEGQRAFELKVPIDDIPEFLGKQASLAYLARKKKREDKITTPAARYNIGEINDESHTAVLEKGQTVTITFKPKTRVRLLLNFLLAERTATSRLKVLPKGRCFRNKNV